MPLPHEPEWTTCVLCGRKSAVLSLRVLTVHISGAAELPRGSEAFALCEECSARAATAHATAAARSAALRFALSMFLARLMVHSDPDNPRSPSPCSSTTAPAPT